MPIGSSELQHLRMFHIDGSELKHLSICSIPARKEMNTRLDWCRC